MSAIGSLTITHPSMLPARLHNAGKVSLERLISKANATQIEPAHIAMGPTTDATPVMYPHGVLASLFSQLHAFLGHC
jgi:hypothetical protein